MAYTPFNNSNKQPGTGFTNLQRILDANKNNKLGQAVGSGIGQVGNAARSSINQAGQQFQTKVGAEKGRLAGEESLANRVLGNVSAATDSDVTAFETIRSGESRGPKGLDNAEDIQSRAQGATQLGKQSGTQYGRQGLLQRFVGGPNYNAGQQRLDSVLLGQGQGANQLRQARQGVAGLSNEARTSTLAAEEVGKELEGNAKGLAENVIGQLGGQVTGYDAAMIQKAKDVQANRDKTYQDMIQDLKSGNVTQEEMDLTGLRSGAHLYDADISEFLSRNPDLATKLNVQQDPDFLKMDALRKLSGQSLTGAPSGLLQEYKDRSQKSIYDAAIGDYDKQRLQEKLDEEQLKLIGHSAGLLGQIGQQFNVFGPGGDQNTGFMDEVSNRTNAYKQYKADLDKDPNMYAGKTFQDVYESGDINSPAISNVRNQLMSQVGGGYWAAGTGGGDYASDTTGGRFISTLPDTKEIMDYLYKNPATSNFKEKELELSKYRGSGEKAYADSIGLKPTTVDKIDPSTGQKVWDPVNGGYVKEQQYLMNGVPLKQYLEQGFNASQVGNRSIQDYFAKIDDIDRIRKEHNFYRTLGLKPPSDTESSTT